MRLKEAGVRQVEEKVVLHIVACDWCGEQAKPAVGLALADTPYNNGAKYMQGANTDGWGVLALRIADSSFDREFDLCPACLVKLQLPMVTK